MEDCSTIESLDAHHQARRASFESKGIRLQFDIREDLASVAPCSMNLAETFAEVVVVKAGSL